MRLTRIISMSPFVTASATSFSHARSRRFRSSSRRRQSGSVMCLPFSARGSKDHAEYQPDASAYGDPQTHVAVDRAEYNAQCSARNKADANVVLFHGLNIAKARVAGTLRSRPNRLAYL